MPVCRGLYVNNVRVKMASQKQQWNSMCGKCSKRVVKVRICCEGDCERWFHPRYASECQTRNTKDGGNLQKNGGVKFAT